MVKITTFGPFSGGFAKAKQEPVLYIRFLTRKGGLSKQIKGGVNKGYDFDCYTRDISWLKIEDILCVGSSFYSYALPYTSGILIQ